MKYLLFAGILIIPVFLTGCSTVYYPETVSDLGRQSKGVYHTVKSGETLWNISQVYGVDVDQVAWANRIQNTAVIKKGERLFIPGAARVLTVDAAKPDFHVNDFEWPLKGKILSYFQGRNTDFWKQGIRIQTSPGEKVGASRGGTVVFVDDLTGYGPTVIIDHRDGFMSVYANNGRCVVDLGDKVKKGDTLADTLPGDGHFLYFEIRRKGGAANPLFYLPKI